MLYLGNPAAAPAASALEELFEPHGFVMAVNLVAGNKAGQPHGFAFVSMATDEAARAAPKALNGARLRGVVVKLDEARAQAAWADAGSGGRS